MTPKEKAIKIINKNKEESDLQVKYINLTIKSLDIDELLSISKSNKNLNAVWKLAITFEINRRYIPIIAITAISSIILDVLNEVKK